MSTQYQRAFPTICPRCETPGCTGRLSLTTCIAKIDGLDGYQEAEQLLRDRYAPPTPVVDEVAGHPAMMKCFYGSDILVPWVADDDRCPKARGGPREGQVFVERQGFAVGTSSAMHGECTPCVREACDDRGQTGKAIRAAKWRRQNGPRPEDFVYCKSSYCDTHARKVASPPIEVPEFTNAEDAQAWLDKITEEMHA